MVGVSVCHHIRVGIKRRKAALPELCGLLQVRVAGNTTTLLLEERGGIYFQQPQEKPFFFSGVTVTQSPTISLGTVNSANDMQILQGRITVENLQRTPSADILNTSESRN
ncbi:Hypothetical predicted protein [Marmota monax]|uniref:Uncharacterized protein n=1 Tax=Marmota monax TaxID=9995 RepID=A0A5E4CNR6_MARMO|nr:hypothetical protein GHT09_007172 [Marmota monax]VTJ82789.1 Hypothetical predicted protein [Marmota monax]